jgi:hypothetical protein
MELIKRHNVSLNGKNCWFKVKIRSDADIEKDNYAETFMNKLTGENKMDEVNKNAFGVEKTGDADEFFAKLNEDQ